MLVDYATNGILNQELIMVGVCEKMGWDYHTYLKQPHWFLNALQQKMSVDAQKQNNEINKK